MFPNLFPKKDGMIGKALRKQLHRSVQSLVFGRTLLRKVNFVPVSGHWGTLPLSMKGAPNGTTSTELYGRV